MSAAAVPFVAGLAVEKELQLETRGSAHWERMREELRRGSLGVV